MADDPLARLAQDRSAARRASDPMVDRCVLGTISRNRRAALRTLVLRDIDDRLALFYSNSSSKHIELMNADHVGSLLVFLPSIGVQYRMEARFEAIARSVIEAHWQLKPNAAKRMDSVYERLPQSTLVDDFEAFETQFAAAVPPRRAPRNCAGVFIVPQLVERLELRTDPTMHERIVFTRNGDGWRRQYLVP